MILDLVHQLLERIRDPGVRPLQSNLLLQIETPAIAWVRTHNERFARSIASTEFKQRDWTERLRGKPEGDQSCPPQVTVLPFDLLLMLEFVVDWKRNATGIEHCGVNVL